MNDVLIHHLLRGKIPNFSSFSRSILAPHKFLQLLMLGGALSGARVASAQTITRDVWTGISGNSVTAIPVATHPAQSAPSPGLRALRGQTLARGCYNVLTTVEAALSGELAT
jgi:hypothetical protein